jgi:hypothetical protein
VPPDALTVTVVEPPKHAMEPDEEEADSCVGSVIVTAEVSEQPLLSVTVNV